PGTVSPPPSQDSIGPTPAGATSSVPAAAPDPRAEARGTPASDAAQGRDHFAAYHWRVAKAIRERRGRWTDSPILGSSEHAMLRDAERARG
ncbi:MAG TPA: hypothetical protein VER17_18915, partial [Tepidisphaeraceae bacterium]|nr:hypothetical protein [Tepidisphaeraceae bacterium]